MRVLSLLMKGGHICTQVLNAFSRVSFIVYVTLAMGQVDAEVTILQLVQFVYHLPKLCVVAADATVIALSNFLLFVFSVCFVFFVCAFIFRFRFLRVCVFRVSFVFFFVVCFVFFFCACFVFCLCVCVLSVSVFRFDFRPVSVSCLF